MKFWFQRSHLIDLEELDFQENETEKSDVWTMEYIGEICDL